MKHHPVVIITSDPEGIAQSVKHLEVDGYEVKILDSLNATMLDFLGALSSTDPDTFSAVNDNPPAPESLGQPETSTAPTIGSAPVVGDTLDVKVEETAMSAHVVDGDKIVLHPVSKDPGDSTTTFKLTESAEDALVVFNRISLFESETDATENNTVSVDLEIPSLNFHKVVTVELSDETMNPPVIMIGADWLAANQTTANPDADLDLDNPTAQDSGETGGESASSTEQQSTTEVPSPDNSNTDPTATVK